MEIIHAGIPIYVYMYLKVRTMLADKSLLFIRRGGDWLQHHVSFRGRSPWMRIGQHIILALPALPIIISSLRFFLSDNSRKLYLFLPQPFNLIVYMERKIEIFIVPMKMKMYIIYCTLILFNKQFSYLINGFMFISLARLLIIPANELAYTFERYDTIYLLKWENDVEIKQKTFYIIFLLTGIRLIYPSNWTISLAFCFLDEFFLNIHISH